MRKPKLYVLVGVPGSGKSTWINNQEWATKCVVISTDDLVDAHAATIGQTYSDVFKDYMPTAVQLMTDQVIAARKKKADIIWDQTSVSVGSRKKKLRMLPNYYKIAVVFPTPDATELQRRLDSRPGKNIPKQVSNSMAASFVMPTEEEGFDEVWHA